MALQIIRKFQNPALGDKWEVTVATSCGPRTVIASDITKAFALAEREADSPRRPSLVRVPQ